MTATSCPVDQPAHPRARPRLTAFDLLRTALGLLLLATASLKGWQLATEPTPEKDLLTSRWFLIAAVEGEFLLALWLLSGLYRRLARWTALGCFTLFAGLTLVKATSGAGTCGCFGKIEVNPWHTLLLDMAVIGLLLACRPRRLAGPASQQLDAFDRLRRRGAVLALLFLCAGIPGAAGMARYRPASIGDAGRIIGNSKFVVLEPETWTGKRFPLQEYIDVGDQLADGKWVVVFYRHDCHRCQEEIPRFEHLAQQAAGHTNLPRVALIELPPYAAQQSPPPNGICLYGRLNTAREWFVTTPAGVVTAEGVVQSGWQDGAAEPLALLGGGSASVVPDR